MREESSKVIKYIDEEIAMREDPGDYLMGQPVVSSLPYNKM